MNKLLATLIAGLFATSVYAQSTTAPATPVTTTDGTAAVGQSGAAGTTSTGNADADKKIAKANEKEAKEMSKQDEKINKAVDKANEKKAKADPRKETPPQDRARAANRAKLSPEELQKCDALAATMKDQEAALKAKPQPLNPEDERPLTQSRKEYREMKCA